MDKKSGWKDRDQGLNPQGLLTFSYIAVKHLRNIQKNSCMKSQRMPASQQGSNLFTTITASGHSDGSQSARSGKAIKRATSNNEHPMNGNADV